MRGRVFHARLVVLLALLAMGGQAAVAFESAWHVHDQTSTHDEHEDGCAVCYAIAQTGTPAEPPPSLGSPVAVLIIRIVGQPRPAHLFAAPAIAPRGPPPQPAA